MPGRQPAAHGQIATFSPIMLADRLLTLAQQAAGAGLAASADRLVMLAHAVMDEPGAACH